MHSDSRATDNGAIQARHWSCAGCGKGAGKFHELKTWTPYFSSILGGHKQFELRKDDRGFEVGDTLWLREWDPETEKYTGREIYKRVGYMLRGGFGLQDGYVIMGLLPS